MNVVVLSGNLTKDPELRYSTGANQTAICKFSIAVNDGFGDKKQTSFIPITVFGKAAENCENFLKKGSKVIVKGRIQTGSYEKNGQKVYTTDVIADNYVGVEFLSTNADGGQKTAQNENPSLTEAPEGFTSLADDDIPF